MTYSLQQALQWSPFVERLTNRYPDIANKESYESAWQQGELFTRVYDAVIGCTDEQALFKALRVQRNTMMGRIGLRDLQGMASLDETIKATSELADALVSASLDWYYPRYCQRYGTPVGRESGDAQQLIVIGMGKLGGQELNFSSDIDLIFAFPEAGETEGAARSISNDQFFIRLGQAVNKSLVDMTVDGFVYRVDMRLRPFGDTGPLAVSFSGLENYYEIHGRAWERYALVKARVIAGDKAKGAELFKILKPFIYRRYVDFSAMDSLRELKSMIADQVAKKGMQHNLKLGAGGIREIEFIVQSFQLVHGGREITLQGSSLLPILHQLVDKQFLEADVASRLEDAYRFLRAAENRVQMWNDQQVHDLPKDQGQQLLLAQSLGYPELGEFNRVLAEYRDYVQQQFSQVFGQDESELAAGEDGDYKKIWQSDDQKITLSADTEVECSQSLAESMQKVLHDFKLSRAVQAMSRDALDRLDAVMPLVLKELLAKRANEQTLKRVVAILESIAKRSVYLILLKENPQALKHLVQLCESSAWMADMLVKYPALLDQLIDERDLYSPLAYEDLKLEACQLLTETGLDEELFMERLRQWKHAQVFKVAAADVTGNVPVMKVSDYLTWIAQAVLDVSVEFCWQFMQQRSGIPGGVSADHPRNPFMVLGYGKLGGIELGYGSDLDMVFLYQGVESGAMTTATNGKQLDNAIYFIRMGQKLISILSTVMPSGRLYEVDCRLRPNGNSGMLVTDLPSFQAYIENKAWNWEHQALVRARAVAGDDQAVEAFEQFRLAFLCQSRDPEKVRSEVVEMRQKMQQSLDKSDEQWFDLKQGVGGIVDIEFMMQYLVLAYAKEYPNLAQYSDNVRILEQVSASSLLSNEDVQSLTDAYKVYRSKYHRLSLANDKAMVEQSCYRQERAAVHRVWQSLMLA
ncbi:bifunctional [glutamate--ammonia ligase]-adenylyl-L-tyrosine phosphorylase/[glutamate--ammonia-ligase] adenylyltransferase [Thiomicrorhabdus sediminis]|uniref:Bifunctional glutamine synthetase adenylyltransferase/adenylyl-removing enzyme n=1 Tax=Thiomicrorhabdus sediminis TaxID=2580412 RepID=A0A4P9K4J5_9GAMM|nr:bifunctional [glutamate--ammonia ligase]-adenylyl-L-tyrosine phosphorylase/[glutamate--ammonia-ligase] adenylyltransferase [Thiomicrorhabdus sediminis]QCU89651.1 bifunctional [glutamate--ammonia ligase]-adenylyl-L-tyrosine phosphorylase/[glutamate--ammonia-ligase] adenylyltransferase [Thiomicrorhabdus sediminis]